MEIDFIKTFFQISERLRIRHFCIFIFNTLEWFIRKFASIIIAFQRITGFGCNENISMVAIECAKHQFSINYISFEVTVIARWREETAGEVISILLKHSDRRN